MASKSLGVLTLDLVARTGGFEQGMDRAERSTERWKKQAEKDAKAVDVAITRTATVVAAAAAALVGSITVLTRQGMDAVDAQSKFARSLDTTYDSVTALRMAFGDSGIDGFEGSMNRLNRRLGAAELGRGAALKAVQELSLNLKDLAQVDAAERVAIIADRIKDVATNSQTAARYAQDLGFEQREAAQFFLQGGDAIRAYTDQVDRLGLSLSQTDADQVEAAVQAMGVFGDLTHAAAQHFAVELSPAIQAAADAIGRFAEDGGIKKLAESLHLVAEVAAVAGLVIASRLAGGVLASAASFTAGTIEALRYQAALARMVGISGVTTAGLATMTVAARTASAAMAVVGGPAGAIILAAGALTYFATRASEAEREAEALDSRITKLGGSFDKLTAAQASAAILDYDQKLESATLAMQAAEAKAFTLRRNLEQFPNSKKAEQWAADLIRAEGAVDDARAEVDAINSSLERLNGIVQAGGAGALADDASEASEAFQKLNRQLTERLALVGLGTEAERLAARVSGGYVEGLKEGEGELLVAIQQQIDAREASIAAEERAAKAAADARKSAAQEEKSRLQGIANEITALERAAATWGMTADEVKIYGLEVQGATQAQLDHARSLLETTSGLEKAKQEQEAYLRLVQDLRTDEEKLTDQLHERLAVLDAIAAAGGVGSDEYQETARRIVDGGFTDAPEFGGLAPEVAGPFGELSKIDEAQEKLQEWYDTQLEMLEEFRAERADLAAQWDAQELALKQEHEDELARIEQARQMAQLAAAESIFGDLAGLAKTFAGEQSGIYKAMFAVQKAASIAQSVVAIQTGIAMAAANPWPANLAAMASVAAATASIVGNIAAVGMAHDGIDSVPQTGTWLLQKGERVTTAETSAKLDRTLERVASNQGGGAKPPNLINNGPPMTMRQELQGDQINYILELAEDRMSSSVMKDGKLGKATRQAFGLRRYAK